MAETGLRWNVIRKFRLLDGQPPVKKSRCSVSVTIGTQTEEYVVEVQGPVGEPTGDLDRRN